MCILKDKRVAFIVYNLYLIDIITMKLKTNDNLIHYIDISF